MQKYTQPSTFASPLFVGMDVHRKTIAFCVYDDETGRSVQMKIGQFAGKVCESGRISLVARG